MKTIKQQKNYSLVEKYYWNTETSHRYEN